MAARPRLTTKQVEAALKLREKGYSWTIIGQRYGVSDATVRRSVQAYMRAKEDAWKRKTTARS